MPARSGPIASWSSPCGLDLERDLVGRGSAEGAQDGELEIVGSLVWKVVARADASEDERRDALQPLARGDREHYPVTHGTMARRRVCLDSTAVTTPGVVKFNALNARLALATLRELGDRGLGSKLSRVQLSGVAADVMRSVW
jgi:hypothetical protein